LRSFLAAVLISSAASAAAPVPTPAATDWRLVWSDEFDGPQGQPANPAHWTHEIGDGTRYGNAGWGNDERQYYTDRPFNVSTDGAGHLAITAARADGSLSCYYGPCEYTSARLVSRHKAEFKYGRIESRIRVPKGAGLWPAFWSLGTNIGEAGWPEAGEIDFMEFVGRQPREVFGTLHGPGYSGSKALGGTHTLGAGVYEADHVFAVEWQPDLIEWFVDGVRYHRATPARVAPRPWVFDHPFFLILNLAVGGHFGGPVARDTVFPQAMLVDYVRVSQKAGPAAR
jgi:beta-glucanase (GH16 family)